MTDASANNSTDHSRPQPAAIPPDASAASGTEVMAEVASDESSSAPDAPSRDGTPSDDSSSGGTFRMGRVLAIVGPVALLLGGAVLFFGSYDGANQVREWMKPKRVTVTGTVYFGDEPLSGGEIYAQPVQPGLKESVGFLDNQGRFTLKMDIRGDYVPGTYVGEHIVTVKKYDPESPIGAFQPDLFTPRKYLEPGTSPLRIKVDPDPSKNDFTIRLDWEEPEGRKKRREAAARKSKETEATGNQ